MYCRAARFALLAAILLAGCARRPPAAAERIAILRFENLSGNSSVDWQGRALSEVLAQQIGGIPSSRLHAFDRTLGAHPNFAPGISTENTQAMAAGATRIGYGEYSVRKGRLEARLTIEDPRTLKMVKVVEASAPAGDVLGAAAGLARQITAHPAPFTTANREALMLFVKGMEAGDSAVTEAEFSQAVAADPDFYPAYFGLAQVKAQQRDREGARAVIEQGLARPRLSALERARFELELADLGGDAGARLAALGKLARLDSSDAAVWRTLAETAMNRHDYRQALQAWQAVVRLTPDDTTALNSLAYAAAPAGELETAMAALRSYQSQRPDEVNPLDSMGDVNLACGRLAEAEDFYLQAQKRGRAFLNDADLLKAALARLLDGDAAAAGKLADQYLAARQEAKDPIVDYRRAQWTWITGRRKEALGQLEAFAHAAEGAPPMREMASRAWMEISLWNLMLGNREDAQALAQKALSLATPVTAGNAVIARFLAQHPAPPAEWMARAAQQFPAPPQAGIRDFSLAYALLVSREFAAALPVLKQMWENGAPGADEGLPVMLAWCYLETGNAKDAAALLRSNPIPSSNVFTPYTSFYLPRLFFLRARLAEKDGRRDEARAQYRRFMELSGPDALAWGEEQKARAAL